MDAALWLILSLGVASGCDADDGSVRRGAPIAPALLRVIGGTDGVELFEIRDAAFNGASLVILTAPEPAVHLFSGGELVSQWGREGEGPGELSNPQEVLWGRTNRILVRDGLDKLVSYDLAGTTLATRPIFMVNDLAISGNDTLLKFFTRSNSARVVRVRGAQHDTIVAYEQPDNSIRLAVEGSPSLNVPAPYTPGPVWELLVEGRVAFWPAAASEIQMLDLEGNVVERWQIPWEPYLVTSAYREAWFRNRLPQGDFMGRGDIFRALREKAPELVEFPSHLPRVLDLLTDPAGGVWVQRTPDGSGEIWTHLSADGAGVTMRLPLDREMLAVGVSNIAVRAQDELEIQMVEVYRKPVSTTGE